jgi:hypothetical protein
LWFIVWLAFDPGNEWLVEVFLWFVLLVHYVIGPSWRAVMRSAENLQSSVSFDSKFICWVWCSIQLVFEAMAEVKLPSGAAVSRP